MRFAGAVRDAHRFVVPVVGNAGGSSSAYDLSCERVVDGDVSLSGSYVKRFFYDGIVRHVLGGICI